jgi:hypothetical protein
MIRDENLMRISSVGKFKKPKFLEWRYTLNLGILVNRLNKQG